MKKILYLIMLTLFISCNTSKKITKTEETQASKHYLNYDEIGEDEIIIPDSIAKDFFDGFKDIDNSWWELPDSLRAK